MNNLAFIVVYSVAFSIIGFSIEEYDIIEQPAFFALYGYFAGVLMTNRINRIR